MTTANPDRACPHEDFNAVVAVNRLCSVEGGPVDAYSADITVSCAQCGEPFRWIGAPAGLMPTKPMVSVDETELHAPLRPASSDPDFGLGIPGFAIRHVRWVDADWLRLLAHLAGSDHGDVRLPYCWMLDRARRLRGDLGLSRLPAGTSAESSQVAPDSDAARHWRSGGLRASRP